MSEEAHLRITIPKDVRQRLWVAAAGRCEFNGCNKPIGVDFLTKRVATTGEVAHIISDSPKGPRGDKVRSAQLAASESNLMLACFDCHSRIDRVRELEDFPEELLLRWKQEHERRVAAIYQAEVRQITQPLVMTLPIRGHIPQVTHQQVVRAILKNSDYKVHPQPEAIELHRADFDFLDSDSEYWPKAQRALERWFSTQVEPRFKSSSSTSHVSVIAFAPIPLLFKLGALLGDKRSAMVLDLPGSGWLWRTDERAKESADDWFTFSVPAKLPARVFIALDISGHVSGTETLPKDVPVVRFSAKNPQRELLESEANLGGFRRQFNRFLTEVHRAGASKLDVLPATPLSASVEAGRCLLPKIFERVSVWEYQAPNWVEALQIVQPQTPPAT